MSTSSGNPATDDATAATNLPLRDIPGSYGIPVLQSTKDSFEYFFGTGGKDEFFRSRVQKYQSTVFRVNMPPGPLITHDPKVIVLLDAKSFPVLFDVSKVEKKDLFTGTYMPSTNLTGGYRVLSYLDPSEPRHAQLKNLLFFMLKSASSRVIPQFETTYTELFEGLETELSKKGKAPFNDAADLAAFRFLGRAFFEVNPEETMIGKNGPMLTISWLLFNLSPQFNLRLPSILIKSNYQKLYNYFDAVATSVIKQAEALGIPKDEAVHNILFAVCFNTFGSGDKTLFWKDYWLGNLSLQDKFPRLYALESRKRCTVADRISTAGFSWCWNRNISDPLVISDLSQLIHMLSIFNPNSNQDKLICILNQDERFSVQSVRKVIDEKITIQSDFRLKWNNLVPLKSSCFVWRAGLNRIPVAKCLQDRGIQIQNISCTGCVGVEETTNHALITCPKAIETHKWIFRWCKIPFPPSSSISCLLDFAASWGNCPKKRKILEAIIHCSLWCIWKARNDRIFNRRIKSPTMIADEIILTSFTWVKYRGKNPINWCDWCSGSMFSL